MAAQENSMTKKWQKSYFDVVGLCCSTEVPLVENILKSLEGIKEYSVIVPTRTVIVVHDNLTISQLQIVKALNQARLEANVRAHGETNYKNKWPSLYAVASGVLLALSFLKYVYHPLQWLALGAVAVGIIPIILKSFTSLRNLRLDTNILMLIAVVGTIAIRDYVEAGTIVFLFTIAEWLESRAGHKASAVMTSLMSIAPQNAVIAETGDVVDVDEVKLNTFLAVKAGEVIPIDGIVVDGTCEVDEKTLTGESFPVAKQTDSTVWAGTINVNGYITVKTTALAEDCVVAKMAKLVEEAQSSKSSTQRFIDKFAQYYTPAVVIASACLAVIPVALGVHNRNHWFHLALVVLVSACPCALILSTPVATFCALTKAAKSGLLVKGGDCLEILSKIKIMAFDKTGTITRGEFVVVDFRSLCEDISMQKLLYWVSSIESKSSHPMAASLVEHGRSLSIEPKPDDVVNFQNFPGEGVYGEIDGKDIYIGSKKIALRTGCESVPTLEGDTKGGKTIGYIFSGAILIGIFNLSDACRSGAGEAIKELKLLGIKTAMLTGDNEAAAMHAQEQLGKALDVVHAELLPRDKAKIVEDFKKDGPTAMVGDGLNDAPALAAADIGISMGISGSALATETGNVILMSNDLRKVPKAIQLARKTHRKVVENVILSISAKSAILALAAAGHPLIWAAVLADVGTCVLVILNSMLLLRGTHEHEGKCCKSSATSHAHKNGCNTKTSDNQSSHNNKHCCSNSKEDMPPKCSSRNCASKCESNNKDCCSKEKALKECKPQTSCSQKSASRCEAQKECQTEKCASKCNLKSFNLNSCEDSKCRDNHSSHNNKHCCSNSKEHMPRNCASKCESNNKDCCSKKKDLKECKPQTSCSHKSASRCEAQKECQTEKCTSKCNLKSFNLNSCEDSKCMESDEKHSGHASSGGFHEAKHCGHGSHGIVIHELDQSYDNHLNHGHSSSQSLISYVAAKCSNLIDLRSNSAEGDDSIHEEDHDKHGCCEMDAHDLVSDSPCNLLKHCSEENGHRMSNNGHCHSMHHGENHEKNHVDHEAVEPTTDSGCNHHHHHRRLEVHPNVPTNSGCDNHHPQSTEGYPKLRNCCTVIAIEPGASSSMHACTSLKKTETGGCCRSYIKECCKHGHFGSGFGGGLTEIITE
ncbi:E1-E2_ATPase domain-containing protein/Hydrolase domain-containing protein [Cephalotus follicularis]|uniref:E1-E2_ATPase domain-containing protein/Hydrolase domain-containing protein n=1 Tax=Cephalotus follicularis TaxID=3775 RepID=A0A1Q3B4Z1_CEPFO|nr:E1-E2_ATPase domain-containing protein/Hydrolase domain-containing protein [Cephalotus follicularis]